MPLLPNGLYRITNKTTGEIKDIPADQLGNYGLTPTQPIQPQSQPQQQPSAPLPPIQPAAAGSDKGIFEQIISSITDPITRANKKMSDYQATLPSSKGNVGQSVKNAALATGNALQNTLGDPRFVLPAAGLGVQAATGGMGFLPAIGLGAAGGAMQGAGAGDELNAGNIAAGGVGGALGAGAGNLLSKAATGLAGAATGKATGLAGNTAPGGAAQALIGELAPYGIGATLGGAGGLGGLFGQNKTLGTVSGVASGLALTALLKNPAALAAVAQGLTKGGSALPPILSGLGSSSAIGTNSLLSQGGGQTSPLPAIRTTGTTPEAPKPTGSKNMYGFTPDQLQAMTQMALKAGDTKSAGQLHQAYLDEVDFQAKQDKSPQINPKAKNALTALDQVEGMAITPGGKIDRAKILKERLSPGNSLYESQTYQIADQLLRSQTSRAPTDNQIKEYRDQLFPDAALDNDAEFKGKLDNIRTMLKNLYYSKPTADLTDTATP